MTCHIGISSSAGAVLISDSQGSTATSGTSGYEKQFVGPDFLLGGAGALAVLQALFDKIEDAAGPVR